MIRRVVAPRPTGRRFESTSALESESPCSVEAAYEYCAQLAEAHFENFSVVTRFLPARLRPHVWTLYAFARMADDFTDEPRYAGRRADELSRWNERLELAFHGEADHPVFIALRETIDRCELPITPLSDVLSAFRMDLSQTRYSTYRDLERYFAYAAHPVGRLALHMFGYRDPALQRYADDLCSAVQLANIIQDVGRALAKDRIYLPAEDLAHFGVDEATLFRRVATPEFKSLMRFQVARARALFERGRPIIDQVGRDLGFELAMLWIGCTTLLDKIEAVDYDVFNRRPRLGATDRAKMIARAATLRWPTFARNG